MPETTIIYLQESALESWKRDAGTVAACLAMILPGWWIGSDAMQWIGAVLFSLWLLARLFGTAAKNRCTIEEARAKLDAAEAARMSAEALDGGEG